MINKIEIFDDILLNKLAKQKKQNTIMLIIASLLFVALEILIFMLTRRNYYTVFSFLFAVVLIVYLIVVYYFVVDVISYNKSIKSFNDKQGRKVRTLVFIRDGEQITVNGIPVKSLYFLEDDFQREYYIFDFVTLNLEVGKLYKLILKNNIIVEVNYD